MNCTRKTKIGGKPLYRTGFEAMGFKIADTLSKPKSANLALLA